MTTDMAGSTNYMAESTKLETSAPLLTHVRVDDLFGRYTYEIDVPKATDGRLLLLHGDNGSGKTTLLRLLWNLLSSADDRGHRTMLARTPFRRLLIDINEGLRIVVNKQGELLGSYDIVVEQPAKPNISCRYTVDDTLNIRRNRWEGLDVDQLLIVDEDPRMSPEIGDLRMRLENYYAQNQYIEFLASQCINPLLLADDRSLYSDDPELERLRERLAGTEDHPRVRPASARSGDIVARELRVTLRRVNDRLRTLTLGGQNTGSAGANTIYKNVLMQLAAAGLPSTGVSSESRTTSDRSDVEDLLQDLAKSSPRFEEFGLVPHFAAGEFMDLLATIRDNDRRRLAQEILVPYLDSLRARQEALKEAEQLLRSLISIVNAFLVDKQITFTPRDGLTIVTDEGIPLDPASLSSGERQLTMLLCTTILASRDSRLFIIDEPELSLGLAWQRDILDALLDLTRGTALQFVVATHSVEIISGQPQSLVKLVRQKHVQRHA